jgi:opacity protein-like surface antigen
MNIKYPVILLILLALSAPAEAQRFNKKKIKDTDRERTWEVTLLTQYQTGSNEAYEGGSSIDIDSSLGFGIGVGWNWTEKFNISWRFAYNTPDYTAIIVPDDPDQPSQSLSYSMSRFTNQIDATWHFFSGPITPYVQGGVGWTKLDSNIPDQPPTIGCWWDPWWGYICFEDWSTYKTSKFTYNLGLGLRWDINAALFVRGSYNREFISLDNGSTHYDTVTLEGGVMW